MTEHSQGATGIQLIFLQFWNEWILVESVNPRDRHISLFWISGAGIRSEDSCDFSPCGSGESLRCVFPGENGRFLFDKSDIVSNENGVS